MFGCVCIVLIWTALCCCDNAATRVASCAASGRNIVQGLVSTSATSVASCEGFSVVCNDVTAAADCGASAAGLFRQAATLAPAAAQQCAGLSCYSTCAAEWQHSKQHPQTSLASCSSSSHAVSMLIMIVLGDITSKRVMQT